METVELAVEGMECDACVQHVTNALGALPGIGSVNVSLSDNSARVTFDPALLSRDAMTTAIKDEGYDAS